MIRKGFSTAGAFEQRKHWGLKPCECLGRDCSERWEQQVQRPWGRDELGVVRDQQCSLCVEWRRQRVRGDEMSQVITERWLWVPCIIHQTPTGYVFYVRQCVCFNAFLSNHPTLSFSHLVKKSVLYIFVSFAALHIDGWYRLSRFCICALISHICLSLSDLLQSVEIGSAFIYLIRTDSNMFLFLAE